jgi:hypothetical protein
MWLLMMEGKNSERRGRKILTLHDVHNKDTEVENPTEANGAVEKAKKSQLF